MPNKGEAMNGLARIVFFGSRGLSNIILTR